jgi:hypothetical protein
MDKQASLAIAQRYLNTTQPLKCLGWGIGGFVYLSPDGLSAVKVHRGPGYLPELETYRRLRRLGIRQLHGLNIPRLLGNDDTLLVIRMDVVSAPFLLDFAGVLFRPPDFPDDPTHGWQADVEAKFGPNAWIAHLVFDSLAKHGIYYVDFRPTNLKLEGYPGLEPWPTDHESDDSSI